MNVDAEAEETPTLCALRDGDVIDFLCDYYDRDGNYENSYMLGEQMVVDGELQVYYAYFKAGTRTLTTYRFTDLYQQHYWTLPIEG